MSTYSYIYIYVDLLLVPFAPFVVDVFEFVSVYTGKGEIKKKKSDPIFKWLFWPTNTQRTPIGVTVDLCFEFAIWRLVIDGDKFFAETCWILFNIVQRSASAVAAANNLELFCRRYLFTFFLSMFSKLSKSVCFCCRFVVRLRKLNECFRCLS